MNDVNDQQKQPRASIADSMLGSEKMLRHAGKDFLIDLYTAIRSLRLYPTTNDQAQRALEELDSSSRTLLQIEPEVELRIEGNFLFINGTRIRHDLDSVALFTSVVDTFKLRGVGVVSIDENVTKEEWTKFASILARDQSAGAEDPLSALQVVLEQGGITNIDVDEPEESERSSDDEHSKEIAKRTYERGVAATKDLVASVRMGKSASVKKVKRAVQGIVDQVLGDETSLLGLTTIRDYDEYTFTHSVNVCTFAVSIGRRLGLNKLQLYDLGMAALLHDIGKSRIPLEVLNKQGGLEESEWRMMQSHPWLGVLALFNLRGYGVVPYRSVITAFEHHLKVDLSGYPKTIRPREMSLFSKIVAVADGFDAATTRRSYQTTPMQPDEVLMEMWRNPRRGMDRVLVKGMINLLGVYPVGTCLVLDTDEVGVVHAVNPNAHRIDRPLVRIVRDEAGTPVEDGPIIDLAEVEPSGSYKRSIARVVDPADYNLNPAAHFV